MRPVAGRSGERLPLLSVELSHPDQLLFLFGRSRRRRSPSRCRGIVPRVGCRAAGERLRSFAKGQSWRAAPGARVAHPLSGANPSMREPSHPEGFRPWMQGCPASQD